MFTCCSIALLPYLSHWLHSTACSGFTLTGHMILRATWRFSTYLWIAMCVRAHLAHVSVEILDHSPNLLDTPCTIVIYKTAKWIQMTSSVLGKREILNLVYFSAQGLFKNSRNAKSKTKTNWNSTNPHMVHTVALYNSETIPRCWHEESKGTQFWMEQYSLALDTLN